MSSDEIRGYWEERARQHAGSPAATTNDIYLRQLEISTLTDTLRSLHTSNATVLDVGCGDGYSTLGVAEAISGAAFVGVDYAADMIAAAQRNLAKHPALVPRVAFSVGDVTALDDACGKSEFDIVISDRCLINLESFEQQSHAIAEIARHTRPGGYYVAIENFVEGQEKMNEMRRAAGLPDIPINWHNLYFYESEFVSSASQFFDEVVFKDFASTYYFATRVVYSAMCQLRGEKPDYQHDLHKIAVHLPWIGQFSPIRMAVMCKKG